MIEDAPAQVGGDAFAEPGDVVEAQEGGAGEQHDDAEHRHQRPVQPGRVTCREAAIDHRPQPLADAEHGQRSDHQRQRGERNAGTVGAEQGDDDLHGIFRSGHLI